MKTDRRRHSIENRLRRAVFPTPWPLFLGRWVAPFLIAGIILVYDLWAAPVELFGFLPTEYTLAFSAILVVVSAIWTPIRPLALAIVTVVEIGLASTLLFIGSSLDIPRESEYLAAGVHITIWSLYLTCYIQTEALMLLRQMTGETWWMRSYKRST